MLIAHLFSLALFFGALTSVQAQQFEPEQNFEARYVKACLKDDTERFCRCEFAALRERVKDSTDLEFLAQLEEQTAGQPDGVTDEIMKKLPQDRLQWLIALYKDMLPILQKCPE